MTISKDDLLKRKEEIVTDYNNLVAQIQKGESEIKDMKNNLNALAGALQQTDLFIKQIEDAGEPMPPEKQQALDIATSQGDNMQILEERGEYTESNNMIHETLTTNPREVDKEKKKAIEQEKKEDEKL